MVMIFCNQTLKLLDSRITFFSSILEVNELKTEHEAALYSQKIQEKFLGQFEK